VTGRPAAATGPVDVFFWVQHLLGIGHLTRAATLVRAMRRAGLSVTLVSGGLPVAGLDLEGAEFLQLAPLQSDGIDFKVLLDAAGRPVDEAFKAARREALLAAFAARRPRILMLEMFPFGRRQMRFELLPLLAAARAALPRPRIVGSVRDILVRPPEPERLVEMLTWARDFDRLLAHGDPELVPFERTFPDRRLLGDRLIETGYVVESPALDERGAGGEGRGEIIVSSGGGRVGERLLETALEAAARLPGGPPWRLLAGQHLPDERFAALAAAGPRVVVERARPDFRQLLVRAALSISQGGYNTVMELLAAGCPAIVVPYAGGLETEQTLRARLLAERGLVTVVEEAALDAPTLVAAVQQTLAAPGSRTASPPRMDGAMQTVRLLEELLVQPDTRNRP
jgi:predicted glycosyltransferase